jgi:DNA-binding CsgD family transcriptional regulator
MDLLSKRELEVVRCLAEGLTNRDIAERLKLSQHTIKNYLFRIFEKLGVSSRVELLFMTLSQASVPQASPLGTKENHNGVGYSTHESGPLIKAAEAGMPAAQLALAQLYWAQGSGSEDLIQAYMWYLIATECAAEARGLFTEMMTTSQVDESKRKANVWLSKRKQTVLCGPEPV